MKKERKKPEKDFSFFSSLEIQLNKSRARGPFWEDWLQQQQTTNQRKRLLTNVKRVREGERERELNKVEEIQFGLF